MQTLSFPDTLALIEDRSAALRLAAADAGLAARVPGCPDWSVGDLVAHLGEVQLFWAAAVAAGPAEGPPPDDAVDADPRGELMAWSEGATAQLVASLTEAGPERGCWTWWAASGAPTNAGAVARHQVQEAGVHAYDAQQAAGHSEPLPADVAADGVGEYLEVELPSNGAWPHEPGTVVLDTGRGGQWLIDLGPDGARARAAAAVRAGEEHDEDGRRIAVVTADPGDMVLAFYRRESPHPLRVDGDSDLLPQLLAWPNLD